MKGSCVVTGGGCGVGRAIVERLLADGRAVAVIEADPAALGWVASHPRRDHIARVCGSAAESTVAEEAADRAEALAPLTGWVNNAAIFRDASLDQASAAEVNELIAANLAPAVVGCSTAVRRFQRVGEGGSIVNVSSHQAQRAGRVGRAEEVAATVAYLLSDEAGSSAEPSSRSTADAQPAAPTRRRSSRQCAVLEWQTPQHD